MCIGWATSATKCDMIPSALLAEHSRPASSRLWVRRNHTLTASGAPPQVSPHSSQTCHHVPLAWSMPSLVSGSSVARSAARRRPSPHAGRARRVRDRGSSRACRRCSGRPRRSTRRRPGVRPAVVVTTMTHATTKRGDPCPTRRHDTGVRRHRDDSLAGWLLLAGWLASDELQPHLAQLARMRCTQRCGSDHRVARSAGARGLDLYAYRGYSWPVVFEITAPSVLRHLIPPLAVDGLRVRFLTAAMHFPRMQQRSLTG